MAFTIDNRKCGIVLVYRQSNHIFRYHCFFSSMYLSSIIYTAIIINYTYILDLYIINWYLFPMKDQRLTIIFITSSTCLTYCVIVYINDKCIFSFRSFTDLLSPRGDLKEKWFKREVIVSQLKFKIPIHSIWFHPICYLYSLFILLLDTHYNDFVICSI